jgi:Zn finger protein HypA/HybF involved in hydrogenase expression
MHEHGLMTKLLVTAEAQATVRGGALRAVHVRLGARAASDPEHFRGDFEHVREELGMGPVRLELEVAPEHPGGVELLSIEVGDG